jgi:hypothetical protein
LGLDVVKRQNLIILIGNLGWDFSRDNLGKDGGWHGLFSE